MSITPSIFDPTVRKGDQGTVLFTGDFGRAGKARGDLRVGAAIKCNGAGDTRGGECGASMKSGYEKVERE